VLRTPSGHPNQLGFSPWSIRFTHKVFGMRDTFH
jgi:hypothetical protein